MADSQDIEAKLAAYVDGELPADARTEIEKYLSANPQQRRLIADLMRQRDLLQALPKNAAPADVAESLNAQLERAVLLGDVDAEATAGTIRPWRNVAGIAAVLLLCAGLGLTIYSLLPSPNRKPKDLASITSVPASQPLDKDVAFDAAAAPVTQPTLSEQESRARSALDRRDETITAVEPPPIAQSAAPMAERSAAAPAARESTDALAAVTTTPALKQTPDATEVASIDISTADASATRQQVVHTLTALGATLAKPSTATTTPVDSVIELQVEPQQMSQAVAVAKSFQPLNLPAANLNAATTEAVANAMNASTGVNADAPAQAGNVGGQYQNAMNQQLKDLAPPPPPATLPAEMLTIRLFAKAASTQPATNPSTQPTSIPAIEPTTQP